MMARYRKGDRYLSEEEYQAEEKWEWQLGLFILGAAISGYFVYQCIQDLDWPKWLRFTAIVISGIICGVLISKFYKQVQMLIVISIIGGTILLIGAWLWRNI